MTTITKAKVLLEVYKDRNQETIIDKEIQLHYNLRIAQLEFYLVFPDCEVSKGTIESLYSSQFD